MSTKTERTVEGEQVTVGGVPVTVEIDRGEIRIHVGNSTGGPMRVRVTTSGPSGRVSGSSELTTYMQRDREEARRRYGQYDDQTLEDIGPR